MPTESPSSPDSRKQLDRSLVHGVAWSASARLGSQALTWVVTIIVARLLVPADYGIVAAAAVYIGLVNLLTEFGLATAIVSQRDLSDSAIAQLGGFSVLLGIIALVVTIAVAPLVAVLVGVEEVRQVLPVLGVATVVSALNALPFALLQKRLEFRRLSSLEIFKTLVSSAAVLVFAWLGFGFWSLVLNELVAVMALAIALFLSTGYRLAFPRLNDIRPSLSLSGKVMASRLAWYTYSNADIAIVSRVLGKSAVGDYSMAWNLTNLPSQKIAATIMGVTTGVLASVQRDLPELRRYFLRIAEALALVLYPSTIGLALVAPEMVEVLLGEKWLGAVPVIQGLALATAIRSTGPVCSQVLLARLRADVEMRFTLLAAIVLPIGFVVGARYGVAGVAIAWSVLTPPLSIFQFYLTAGEIQLRLRELLLVLARPALAVLVMATLVLLARQMMLITGSGPAVRLGAMVVVGAITYLVLVSTVMRHRLRAIIALVRSR